MEQGLVVVLAGERGSNGGIYSTMDISVINYIHVHVLIFNINVQV